jgi:hypothetical protein
MSTHEPETHAAMRLPAQGARVAEPMATMGRMH